MGFLIFWGIIKRFSIRRIQPLRYSLILFCLALIISVVFSLNKLNSFKEIYKYTGGLLLFLIAASLDDDDKMCVIRTLVLSGFIISLLAIYQYFFGFQHILNYIAKENIINTFVLDYVARKRVFFPFVTPNTLAGYLAMIIPIALSCKNKILFIIPLSLALLLTKSLGALLSLFFALGFYFYLQGKFKKRGIILLLGLLVTIALTFLVRSTAQRQHLQPIFSTVMRLNYWKDTLEIIKAKPLTGVGIGNFNLPLSRYAHNSYLQIWAEMGIIGIVSFVWLVVDIFKNIINTIKTSPQNNLIVALISANVVFLVHNLVDFTFFLPEVAIIYWVTLGCIIP